MSPKETPKPRSKAKPILMGMAALLCLLTAAALLSGPSDNDKQVFFSEIRKNAIADCVNDPECLENMRLHFDDCLRDNYAVERSGLFTVRYTMDAQGLYDCLNDYQRTP